MRNDYVQAIDRATLKDRDQDLAALAGRVLARKRRGKAR